VKPCLLFAAAFCLAGPVLAGGPIDTVVEPAPAAEVTMPSFSWTGFYVGLSYGNGSASDDGGATDTGTDPRGFQAGYLRDLGTFVLGGELAYVQGGFDDFPTQEWASTRVKLIGGYDAGRFLPYGFVGLSEFDLDNGDQTDTTTIYGLGGRFAVGATGRLVMGIEYLVEKKDDFNNGTFDLDNNDLSLRLDYRF
jgi:outer membrane immunogenic protein